MVHLNACWLPPHPLAVLEMAVNGYFVSAELFTHRSKPPDAHDDVHVPFQVHVRSLWFHWLI